MKNKLIGLAFVSILWLLCAGPGAGIRAQAEGPDGEDLHLKGLAKTLEVPQPDTGLKDFYVFDRAGNITEKSTLYRSDDRVWYKTVNSYDGAGRKVRSELYSEDRSQTPFGLALRKTAVFKYGDGGNAGEALEYDADGKLIATTVKTYDARGNILESTGKMEWGMVGLGPGKPIDLKQIFKYDETGKLIEKQFFLADVKEPMERWLFEYDTEGRPIVVTAFTPTYPDKPPRIAKSFAVYNKQGDVIESRYYEPVKDLNVGEFRTRIEIIDDKGTVRNGTLISDKPFMVLWSVSVCEYKYDAHGNWNEKTCKWKMNETNNFVPVGSETPRRIITYYQ
jgi:hypothetical protein